MPSKTTVALMLSSAIIIDITVWFITLFHLIPLGVTNILVEIGTSAINLAATIIFFMWFIIKRIRLITPKKMLTMAGGAVLGVIPIIGSLIPVWTMAVFFTLSFHKKDMMKSKITSLNQKI